MRTATTTRRRRQPDAASRALRLTAGVAMVDPGVLLLRRSRRRELRAGDAPSLCWGRTRRERRAHRVHHELRRAHPVPDLPHGRSWPAAPLLAHARRRESRRRPRVQTGFADEPWLVGAPDLRPLLLRLVPRRDR